MTPEEFAIARAKLRRTDAELAKDLDVSEDVVHAWLAGSRRVPKRHAQLIEWHAAAAQRQAALEAAGLEECDWLKAFDAQPLPERDEDIEKMESHLNELEAHVVQCPTCRAREQYLAERFPPLPDMPLPLFIRTWGAWADVVERFPKWIRTPMLVLPFLLVFGAIGVATALAHGPWKIVMAVVFIVALLVPRLMR